jgi:8-oxo-dGTP diphosphatase
MPPYTPVLATLGYVLSADGSSVLMIHRNKRPDDIHHGKYNGLGGKVDAGEDVVAAMRREIREEAGIEVEEISLRGTISWPGFGKAGEAWFGFIFRIDRWSGTPGAGNYEGTLEWVPLNGLSAKNLWESDRLWLPLVFDRARRTFHGVMPYAHGRMLSWSFTEIAEQAAPGG